jgi:predicted RND superfamily exporter protein
MQDWFIYITFAAKLNDMAEAQNSSKKYFGLFGIFLVLTIIWLIFFNSWFWIWLPPLLTCLVKAFDVI